jgi:hypothetical protein
MLRTGRECSRLSLAGQSIKGDAMEQVTLLEVKNNGQTLVLMDGRELNVDPGDITTAILWLPTTLLEISDADDNRFFDLCVKVHGTKEEIRASWR